MKTAFNKWVICTLALPGLLSALYAQEMPEAQKLLQRFVGELNGEVAKSITGTFTK